jgi:hypothetical protein
MGALGCMDAEQDSAWLSLLVLSPEYLAGSECQHEMQRAFVRDPDLSNSTGKKSRTRYSTLRVYRARHK